MVHHLLKRDARPVAVRAQLLTAQRPGDVVETVRELTLLQIDPVKAVAPAQHLVLWSRLGSAYDPGELDRLLAERTLVEILGFVRPGEDVALYRAEMERWVLGVRSSPLRHRDPFDRPAAGPGPVPGGDVHDGGRAGPCGWGGRCPRRPDRGPWRHLTTTGAGVASSRRGSTPSGGSSQEGTRCESWTAPQRYVGTSASRSTGRMCLGSDAGRCLARGEPASPKTCRDRRACPGPVPDELARDEHG